MTVEKKNAAAARMSVLTNRSKTSPSTGVRSQMDSPRSP